MHPVLIKQGGILFSSSCQIWVTFVFRVRHRPFFVTRATLSSSYHRGNKGTGKCGSNLSLRRSHFEFYIQHTCDLRTRDEPKDLNGGCTYDPLFDSHTARESDCFQLSLFSFRYMPHITFHRTCSKCVTGYG